MSNMMDRADDKNQTDAYIGLVFVGMCLGILTRLWLPRHYLLATIEKFQILAIYPNKKLIIFCAKPLALNETVI